MGLVELVEGKAAYDKKCKRKRRKRRKQT